MNYKNFYFPGQKADEKIRFVVSKNWIVDFVGIVKLLLLSIFPPIILILFSTLFINDYSSSGFYITISIALFYLAFAIQYSHISWMNDELDLIVVTDKRVIDITEVNFLKHNIVEIPLSQIQNVRGEIDGFLGTMLRFGTVKIYTANHTAVLEIDTISEPIIVARKILDSVQEKNVDATQELPEIIIEKNSIPKSNEAFHNIRENMVASIKNLFKK